MAAADKRRRLIVNADDFGRSAEINAAVIRAHREGILTSASLMVTGAASEEAVRLAREHPRLGVGLHLTLVCGHAALSAAEIPGLADAKGEFDSNPVRAGLRYFFQRKLRAQLRHEIAEQFRRFHQTGLALDHVNGHLNIHLHPAVFDILMENADAWGIRRFRLTRDLFGLNAALAKGRWLYRISHAIVFGALSKRAEPALRRRGIRYVDRVFGLLQTGCVDEGFIVRLIDRLPPGDSELYSHPSLKEFSHEFEALLSPAIRRALSAAEIDLARYQDL